MDDAAAYVALPKARFLKAVEKGILPPPRKFMDMSVWDAEDLKRAFKKATYDYSAVSPSAPRMDDDQVSEGDDWDSPRA